MYSSRILKLKYNVRKQWNYLVLWVYLHPKTSNKIRTLQIVTWVCPKIIPGLKCPSISVPVNSTLSKKGQHCRIFLKILELCPVACKFCFCFFFIPHANRFGSVAFQIFILHFFCVISGLIQHFMLISMMVCYISVLINVHSILIAMYLLQTWGEWEACSNSFWEEPGYLETALASGWT